MCPKYDDAHRADKSEKLSDMAEEVYKYSIRDAVRNGFVKNVAFHEVFLEEARYVRKVDSEKYPDEYVYNTAQLDEERCRAWVKDNAKTDPSIMSQVS